MAGAVAQTMLSQLYHDDETAWLEEMARLATERRFEEMDAEHLAEYLSDMARRDKREVLSRLTTLLTHLLKWDHQPDQRSGGWHAAIAGQRNELRDLLESGTLRNHAQAVLAKAHERAARQAALETGLAETDFPEVCPYTLDSALGHE